MGIESLSQVVSDETAALTRASDALCELGFKPDGGRFARGSRVGSAISIDPRRWQMEAQLAMSDSRVRITIFPTEGGYQNLTSEADRYVNAEADYVVNAAEPIEAKIVRPKFSFARAVAEGFRVTVSPVAIVLAGLPVAIGQTSRLVAAVLLVACPLGVLAIVLAGRLLAQAVAGRSKRPFARRMRSLTHSTLYLGIQPNKTRYEWSELSSVREVAHLETSNLANRLVYLARENQADLAPQWRPWRRRVLFVHAAGFPDNVWSVEKRVALESLRKSWRPNEIYIVPPSDPIGEATATAVAGALWAIRCEIPSQVGPQTEPSAVGRGGPITRRCS